MAPLIVILGAGRNWAIRFTAVYTD